MTEQEKQDIKDFYAALCQEVLDLEDERRYTLDLLDAMEENHPFLLD